MLNKRDIPSKVEDFLQQGRRYITVIRPLIVTLVRLFPARLITIQICGIGAFVLQLAALWLIFSAIGRARPLEHLAGTIVDGQLSPGTAMTFALVAGVALLILSALASFVSQRLSVYTARDFSQFCLADLLRVQARQSKETSPTDFSAAARARPTWEPPPVQQVSYMHRSLDVFSRIAMVASPQVVSAAIGLFVLAWLNIRATLALLPLVLVQGLIVYWQSRRGLASRSRLERTIGEATDERRRLLDGLSRDRISQENVESSIEDVVYGRAGRTIAQEFAFQFAVLYESNFTSKLIAILAVATVIVTFALQSPAQTGLASSQYWIAAAFYILVLRFVFSELEGVMRAIVGINRLFAHLSIYFDLQRGRGDTPADAYATLDREDGSGALLIDAPTSDISDDIITRLQNEFGERADFLRELEAAPLSFDPNQSALIVVPHSMVQLNPARYRQHMSFGANVGFTDDEQHAMKCYWRALPKRAAPLSLRAAFGLGESLNANQVAAFADEIAAPGWLRALIVRDLDVPVDAETWAELRGFHGFLLDIAEALNAPNRLLFIELSMLEQVVRDLGSKCCCRLLKLFGDKIVLFVHYRAKENELAASLKLPCILFGATRQMGSLAAGSVPNFDVYQALLEMEGVATRGAAMSGYPGEIDAAAEEINLF